MNTKILIICAVIAITLTACSKESNNESTEHTEHTDGFSQVARVEVSDTADTASEAIQNEDTSSTDNKETTTKVDNEDKAPEVKKADALNINDYTALNYDKNKLVNKDRSKINSETDRFVFQSFTNQYDILIGSIIEIAESNKLDISEVVPANPQLAYSEDESYIIMLFDCKGSKLNVAFNSKLEIKYSIN